MRAIGLVVLGVALWSLWVMGASAWVKQRRIEPELASPAVQPEPYPWTTLGSVQRGATVHHSYVEDHPEAMALHEDRVAAWARADEAAALCRDMGLPLTVEAFVETADMWGFEDEHDLSHLFDRGPAFLAFLQMQEANARLRITTGDPAELVEFHQWPAWHGEECYGCDTHQEPITDTELWPHVEAWQRAADILGAIVTAELATLEAAK